MLHYQTVGEWLPKDEIYAFMTLIGKSCPVVSEQYYWAQQMFESACFALNLDPRTTNLEDFKAARNKHLISEQQSRSQEAIAFTAKRVREALG